MTEVRLHRIAVRVNRGREMEKNLGYVSREREFENGGLDPRGPWERAQKIIGNVFLRKFVNSEGWRLYGM